MNFDACGHCSRCLYLNWVAEITLRIEGQLKQRAYCILCWVERFGHSTPEEIAARRIQPQPERAGNDPVKAIA